MLVSVVACALVAGTALAGNPPPLVTVGPVSDPNGAVTASSATASGGQTEACLNDQHSRADPSSSSSEHAVGVNDRSCQSGGATNAAGGGAAGAAPSRTVSSARGAVAASGTAGKTRRTNTTRRSAAAAAVSAVDAHGIQITRITYDAAKARSSHQLRVSILVRDAHARLVRAAVVSLEPLRDAGPTIAGTRVGFSNKVGRASLAVPVTKQTLGKRLRFLVRARIPSAHALAIGSVRLPALS
jgi:hypothetical protein